MNVVLKERKKASFGRKIFYISIIVLCFISINIAVYYQVMNKDKPQGNEEDQRIEEYQALVEDFDTIFTNELHNIDNKNYNKMKVDNDKDLIYSSYTNNETKNNSYTLNVNIPCININNYLIAEYNQNIENIFKEKCKNVLETENKNIIYTVEYSGYISRDILSLVIRSTLKEGDNPQRVMVQTYNYDLVNKKEVTAVEMLELNQVSKSEANKKIKLEIDNLQLQSDTLSKLGYSVYTRDLKSDIYNIENVTEFFKGKDGNIYIIYAYGNDNFTGTVDIIVF